MPATDSGCNCCTSAESTGVLAATRGNPQESARHASQAARSAHQGSAARYSRQWRASCVSSARSPAYFSSQHHLAQPQDAVQKRSVLRSPAPSSMLHSREARSGADSSSRQDFGSRQHAQQMCGVVRIPAPSSIVQSSSLSLEAVALCFSNQTVFARRSIPGFLGKACVSESRANRGCWGKGMLAV